MQTFFNLMHCGLQSVNAVFKRSECNLLIFSSKAQVKRKTQNPSNQDAPLRYISELFAFSECICLFVFARIGEIFVCFFRGKYFQLLQAI